MDSCFCPGSRVKTLGESDSDDDAKNWVKKSRKLEKEKAMAEKRVSTLAWCYLHLVYHKLLDRLPRSPLNAT